LGAFYINRVDPFLRKPSCYGEKYGCIELDPGDNIDIDYPEDLAEAEKVAKRLQGVPKEAR
jgi:CMP-N-acetylneuraminic acid synthetase